MTDGDRQLDHRQEDWGIEHGSIGGGPWVAAGRPEAEHSGGWRQVQEVEEGCMHHDIMKKKGEGGVFENGPMGTW